MCITYHFGCNDTGIYNIDLWWNIAKYTTKSVSDVKTKIEWKFKIVDRWKFFFTNDTNTLTLSYKRIKLWRYDTILLFNSLMYYSVRNKYQQYLIFCIRFKTKLRLWGLINALMAHILYYTELYFVALTNILCAFVWYWFMNQ